MDASLWRFLVSSPERPVPYPWERCFDTVTEILFYKNRIDGRIVLDLRPQVNLGGGLYCVNNMWEQLTAAHNQSAAVNNLVQVHHWPANLFRRNINQFDQDTPMLLCSNCCTPQTIYLLVPHLVTHCPLCGTLLGIFP